MRLGLSKPGRTSYRFNNTTHDKWIIHSDFFRYDADWFGISKTVEYQTYFNDPTVDTHCRAWWYFKDFFSGFLRDVEYF